MSFRPHNFGIWKFTFFWLGTIVRSWARGWGWASTSPLVIVQPTFRIGPWPITVVVQFAEVIKEKYISTDMKHSLYSFGSTRKCFITILFLKKNILRSSVSDTDFSTLKFAKANKSYPKIPVHNQIFPCSRAELRTRRAIGNFPCNKLILHNNIENFTDTRSFIFSDPGFEPTTSVHHRRSDSQYYWNSSRDAEGVHNHNA